MEIGFIGIGVMGKSMVMNLMKKGGYKAYVYTRTKSKAQEVLDMGAVWCDTPAKVSAQCNTVITIVGYPKDVEEVILNEKDGVFSGFAENKNTKAPKILIDCTTSSPDLAKRIFDEGLKQSIQVLDAPVSGGDVGAKNGTLTFMIGGDENTFNSVKEMLALMGKSINYHGPAGSGQHTKMSNQIFIASGMIGLCEGLLYAHKAGLDVEAVIKTCGAGAAGSWSLNNYGPRILKKDYEPGFYVEHFIKDLDLAIQSATRMGLHSMPGLTTARSLYKMLSSHNGDKKGTQALMEVLEQLNQ